MVNTLLQNDVDTVSSEELRRLIDEGKTIILDAREKPEYEVSHIPGAVHVGYDTFDPARIPHIEQGKSIVVYCSVGKRSEDVARRLRVDGYENVKNHWGGIFDWTNKGLPVINVKNEQVNIVHPYSLVWGYWINNYEKVYEPR